MQRCALGELRVGDLLAQGGEGAVYQLPLQPHLVFKAYRGKSDRGYLDDLVAWPGLLAARDAEVVRSSAAWPTSVVTGDDGDPVGLVMPRAPRRFSVRHRDGQRRLATLSYLTCDPARPAKAYDIVVPPVGDARRYGLVLALAQLLAAFDSVAAAVSHGDLSTKNVLWSLERGPEVFVIDCDSAEVLSCGDDLAEATASRPARRRAMTPNWDDPAVQKGSSPTLASDRYSLGLIFLRVVGAANFPVQARQRREGRLSVEVPVPQGPAAKQLMDDKHPLWELCARALSLEAAGSRPSAVEWVEPLQEVVSVLGGTGAQTRRPAASPPRTAGPPAPRCEGGGLAHMEACLADVQVTPRAFKAAKATANAMGARGGEVDLAHHAGSGPGGRPHPPTASSASLRAPLSASTRPSGARDDSTLRAQAKVLWRAFWRWWVKAHRDALVALTTSRRRRWAALRVVALLAFDVVGVGVAAGIVALVLSPITRG